MQWNQARQVVHSWLVTAIESSNCHKVAVYARHLENEIERLKSEMERADVKPVRKPRKQREDAENVSDS